MASITTIHNKRPAGAQRIDFDKLMEPVALRLLGEPPQKRGNKWRYGSRGSLAVDVANGRWFDHEANKGGGVYDLIQRQGYDQPAAWLRREGLMAGQPVVAPNHAERKVIANYNYTDENDKLLFQVVRYEPKDFKQRRPDGNAGWIWSLGDTRRVPYLLPELVKAVAAGETIYIPEGEKDVDNLRAIGLAATTNPGGIKKWRDEFSEHLRSADGVVLPDNHAEGREHAEQVIASLRCIAKRIRVLDIGQHWAECPDKGDISDWLAAGHTAEELSAMVTTLPEVAAAADNHSSAAEPPSVVNVASVAWPVMDDAAYDGLTGKIVRTLEPHTEADPIAILLSFLAMIGNVIGPHAHFQVEGDQQRAKLFVVLSGATAKGRKGTALGRVRQILTIAAPEWEQGNINTGLSSGEGVIFHVRDAVTKITKEGAVEVVDGGVPDKRVMLVAEEFASVLSVMERPGNTLSSILRDAWGTSRLQTMTKNSPLKGTGSHISIVAHVTDDELRSKLTKVEMANGFANRFLFAKVRRSKLLPHGGHLDHADLQKLGEEVGSAVENAKSLGRFTMIPEAASVWEAVYPHLTAERPGLLGAIVQRAETQTIRLAVIYAALDNSQHIGVAHLQAALAVWQYCEDSTAQIFGEALGDDVADTILTSLIRVGAVGQSRTEISALFARHVPATRITLALDLLHRHRKARPVTTQTKGHPEERWFCAMERKP